MKYLNLGCGSHFYTNKDWINIDFSSSYENVIVHNLLNGIPYGDNNFDIVYHSHVLEHFSKVDGEMFLKECYRVLKPEGIIRIAIPNLEKIVRNYLKCLEDGLSYPEDPIVRANYDWTLIELFDQTLRNSSGGEMAKYLFQDSIINEGFVFDRIGEEGRNLRRKFYAIQNEKKVIKKVYLITYSSLLQKQNK